MTGNSGLHRCAGSREVRINRRMPVSTGGPTGPFKTDAFLRRQSPYENPAGAAPASGSPAGGGVTRETGVAIHNVGNQVNTCTFTAFDASGQPADVADREYLPGRQEAKFVSEIFENLTSSSGLLAVDCLGPVAMVGAIQDSNGAIVLTPANPD